MGFFDSVKKGMESVNNFNEEARRYKERYANLSKDELEKKFRNSSSSAEKGAIAQLMKEKGYR